MSVFSRIKNKITRDKKMAEIADQVNELIANEPPTEFTKEYFERAKDKAWESSYERLDTPRQRFIFDENVKKAIAYVEKELPAYWIEDKEIYQISRKQLDDMADAFIFQSHLKDGTRKYHTDEKAEEEMEVHIVFLHRLNGLLAPFSDETEDKLKVLKDEMLNITHQYI